MDNKIVHAAPVPPFVTFVASAVPMVFDNSMSYYEALCALWKWLQDDVINVINNNANVTNNYIDLTNEYIEKFNELKEYVDTYFENLDVQEEINNKLDEMAEDGTLTRLLADYLQTQIIYDTTEDMIADADNLVDGIRVETLGYHSVNDNGAGFFVIKNSGTADGYSVIDLQNGLYAHMIFKRDYVTPEMFGAYGDNSHDDSAVLQYTINLGKPVELSKKTYLCFLLTTTASSVVIHGNGATLKRPDLSGEPWNYTPEQMRHINTLRISKDSIIDDIIFDNNCFAMWQVSDQFAQQNSASVYINNNDEHYHASITNCTCKNSAGDGLEIVNNGYVKIENYTSIDTFRGGITIVGNSETEINNWSSHVITEGMHDGIDIEVDSGGTSTIAGVKSYTVINNVMMDYDCDISVPKDGTVIVNNLMMRPFDQENQLGFRLACNEGYLEINNSTMRAGKLVGSNHVVITHDGEIVFNNCKMIGNTSRELIYLTQLTETTSNSKLTLNSCSVSCYNLLKMAVFKGNIEIKDCDIECSNNMIIGTTANIPEAENLLILNNKISFAGRLLYFTRTTTTSKLYLYGNVITGSGDNEIRFANSPDIYFDSTPFAGAYNMTIAAGATPKYYGINRVIVVPSASTLNFRGFVPGEDIAICQDNGAKYRYTSGLTWTAI